MKKCSNCQNKFSCSQDTGCWCFDWPTLTKLENDRDCLCRNCLEYKMASLVNSGELKLSKEDIYKVQQLGEPPYLRKNIDYMIQNHNKKELYVFTSWFLLRKGPCCKNDCTNCPYPKEP